MGEPALTDSAGQQYPVYTSLAAAKELNSGVFLPIAIHLSQLEMPKLQKGLKGTTLHRLWGEAGFLVTPKGKHNMVCSDFKEFITNATCCEDFQEHTHL